MLIHTGNCPAEQGSLETGSSSVPLAARSLRRAYVEGERTCEVLRGVDFEARTGEFLALLGRSGSGTSTLLNLIGGIDRT